MKIFKSVILTATIFLAFLSCQKELAFDNNGASTGIFKKDGSGNCLPVTVTGIFKVDSVLTNALFVDVQINVSTPGNFDIRTDTVNGFSFNKVGAVVFGINTIRLYPTGKPIAAGTNPFTVKYGSSTCSFDITVAGPAAPQAVFSLGGAPGACTGATAGGTYTVGTPLTPANTLTVQVNVVTPGTYVIGAGTTNGFSFSGAGVFTSAGLQNVTLTGSGTPVTAGNTSVITANAASSCTFDITVQPVAPPAVFTLDGAPGGCTGFTLNGTYAVNVATTATNTVTLNVNVTTIGTYTLSTNTMDGITFSKTGTFTTIGAQPVTLVATGTPTAAGPFVFSPIIGASTCTFTVTVQPPPPPAVFTLSGAPALCAPITVNGLYFTSTALNSTNTVDVEVNVSSIGTYTLSTNTVNGIKFSATGVFTVTGLQTVTLLGSGTPGATAANTTLTPQAGSSSCTFDVPVVAAPDGIFTCKINNVPYSFNLNSEAYYFQPNDISMTGRSIAGTGDDFILGIDRSGSGGPVNTGTYVNTLAGSIAGAYIMSAQYFDATAVMRWAPKSIFSTPDPFTITITQITATRVKGTFNGTIRDVIGTGPNTKTVTEGVFDLPIH